MAKTSTPKRPSTFHTFYGGKITIEKKPWGDHFRFIKSNTGKGGMLSSTKVTKRLDKSEVLIKWAVGLVCGHMTSHFENAKSSTFSREEISLVVAEALLKPEEAKVKGGSTGDIIHDFAHAFALAKMNGTTLPTLDHLDESQDDEHRKALNGINAFLDWYNANDVEFLEMEQLTYYNSELAGDTKEGEFVIEYIGIIDLVARVNKIVSIIDYKTSKGVYSDQRYQLASYRKAWNSQLAPSDPLFAKSSAVLNFGKETGDLVQKTMTPEESQLDFDFGFKGLFLASVREEQLSAEYFDSKKNESK